MLSICSALVTSSSSSDGDDQSSVTSQNKRASALQLVQSFYDMTYRTQVVKCFVCSLRYNTSSAFHGVYDLTYLMLCFFVFVADGVVY